MKYLLNIIKILIWPIIFMIGQFLIEYIFVLIFNNKYYSGVNLYNFINTVEYQDKLNKYIDNNTLLIILVVALIFIPLFYLVFKKYKNNKKINLYKFILFIVLGMSISLVYNLLIVSINKSNYSISSISLCVQIISSGIIGPILEELLFRGIVYNKLKQFNSVKNSMIISTLIFSVIHFSVINCIYTLIIGYLLAYVYEKYNSIKYSMTIHISANIATIIFGTIIITQNIIMNIILFTLLLLNLCVILMINRK